MVFIYFRLLPGKGLLRAALVNKEWLRLCRSDSQLRQTVRRYLRHLRRVRLFRSYGRIVNETRDRAPMINTVNKSQQNDACRRRVIGK